MRILGKMVKEKEVNKADEPVSDKINPLQKTARNLLFLMIIGASGYFVWQNPQLVDKAKTFFESSAVAPEEENRPVRVSETDLLRQEIDAARLNAIHLPDCILKLCRTVCTVHFAPELFLHRSYPPLSAMSCHLRRPAASSSVFLNMLSSLVDDRPDMFICQEINDLLSFPSAAHQPGLPQNPQLV